MKKILVIEDDFVLRENACEFLKAENFDAYSASDGAAGVQTAIEIMPDLILCDIAMPKMDGYEVFRTLQTIPVTAQIPFIFITARTQKEDLRLGMQLGADDYITKPYTYDDLLTSINIRLQKYERISKSFESRFLSMIENPLMGIFILHEQKFSYINMRLVKMLGYSNDMDIYKKTFNELIHPEDSKKVNEKILLCIKGVYGTSPLKFRVIKQNGEHLEVTSYFTFSKIKGENSVIGYLLKENSMLGDNPADEKSMIEQITQSIQSLMASENICANDLIKIIRSESGQNKFLNPDELTKREIELIRLMSEGLSNKEIADKLFISQRTVDSHKANILMKTGTKHTAALMMYAVKNNIIEL